MKMIKTIIAGLAIIPSLAMSAPVQTSCIKDLSATNKRVVRCDGIKYNLSVPSECVAGGCGLIFDVHGYSMNGNSQNANTGLAELGREHNYVVVQPSANGGSWGRSDYRKVHDFLLQNKTAWNIDANRIHFTGFSQGSIMTWEFVCKYPELIASAAPIAYQFRSSCFGPGKSNPQIPIFYHTGVKDSFSKIREARAAKRKYVSAMAMTLQHEDVERDYKWEYYSNGEGVDFEYAEHDYSTSSSFGSGHCFPGPVVKKNSYSCKQEAAYSYGRRVMEFFLNHPKM